MLFRSVGSRPPRANIRELLPSLQTVVVLGVDYWHPRPPRPQGLVGKVSCYGWGRDYHKIINKKLKKLARALKEQYSDLEGYWTVDSRPVIERGWAEKSGLGFIGKNTMSRMMLMLILICLLCLIYHFLNN